jgi:Na+-transporting NADH:ubiquinone oxidoreductase subunit NqrF
MRLFSIKTYNVDYEGYTEKKLKIDGDKMSPDKFREFLGSVFSSYVWALKPGASMYVCHPSAEWHMSANRISRPGEGSQIDSTLGDYL